MFAILRSTWADSMHFFVSSDAKLFPLLILNSLRRLIVIVATYFFWLVPLAVYAHMQLVRELLMLGLQPDGRVSSLNFVFCSGLGLLLSFVIILAARASLEAKNVFYFVYYLPRIIPFALIWMLPHLAFFPVAWLVTLFFLDGDFSLERFVYACYRGCKMILCYFPVFLGYGLGALALLQGLRLVTMMLLNSVLSHSLNALLIIDFTFACLFQLLMAALTTTLYIAIKHRNYKLFFE